MPGKGDINPATGKPYAVNPSTGQWDDNYWANVVEPQLRSKYGGGNSGGGGSGAGAVDPVELARKIQQFNVQANQPAIQTLQGQQDSLKDQYSKLLSSVLAEGTVAQNQAIGATNAELARRGITGDSFLAQQTIGSALLPVTAMQQSAAAQVGMGSAQDLNTLAANIASLQAGNPESAINAVPAFAGLQALPSQIALTQAQAGAAGFVPIQPGGYLYNGGANNLINPLQLALKQMGINITG